MRLGHLQHSSHCGTAKFRKPGILRSRGRVRGSATVTVTRNEVCYGLNQKDKFILALVFVDGDSVDGPHYVRHPFEMEPDWHVASVNLDIAKLMSRAEKPA